MDRLPDSFLIENELSLEQIKILLEQINRFNKLNNSYSNVCGPIMDIDGNLVFKKGTLIHGTNKYNEDKLDSISKSGILTGQAVGVAEDGETYYLADFHRVKEDISVYDYAVNFSHNDGRCPFGNNSKIIFDKSDKSIKLSEYKIDISSCVAFVLTPNEYNRELLSYDCYRDGTRESDITRSFINMMPFEDRELGSSILYGVPVNCLEGIIVGGKVLEDKSKIDYLISRFPNCYLISSFGKIIYNPSKGEKLGDEIIELRREKLSLERDKRLLERDKMELQSNLNSERIKNENLWKQMLLNCNSQDIANVLISLGWQGNIDLEYVDNMKKGNSR